MPLALRDPTLCLPDPPLRQSELQLKVVEVQPDLGYALHRVRCGSRHPSHLEELLTNLRIERWGWGWDWAVGAGMGLGVERAGLGQGYEIESGMGQDGIVMDTVRCRIGYLEEIGWDCVVGLLATGHQGLI